MKSKPLDPVAVVQPLLHIHDWNDSSKISRVAFCERDLTPGTKLYLNPEIRGYLQSLWDWFSIFDFTSIDEMEGAYLAIRKIYQLFDINWPPEQKRKILMDIEIPNNSL